jgi:hypothetical protein
LDAYTTSSRGWVVPVAYSTRSGEATGKDTIRINTKQYYFWFLGNTIAGITPRIELCPGIGASFEAPPALVVATASPGSSTGEAQRRSRHRRIVKGRQRPNPSRRRRRQKSPPTRPARSRSERSGRGGATRRRHATRDARSSKVRVREQSVCAVPAKLRCLCASVTDEARRMIDWGSAHSDLGGAEARPCRNRRLRRDPRSQRARPAEPHAHPGSSTLEQVILRPVRHARTSDGLVRRQHRRTTTNRCCRPRLLDDRPDPWLPGARRHIIAGLESIDAHIAPASLDLIICNGVFGWGLDDRTALRAFELLQRPATRGELIIGWNGVRHRPLELAANPWRASDR